MPTLTLRHENVDNVVSGEVRVWIPGKDRKFEQLVILKQGEEASFQFAEYTEFALEEVAMAKPKLVVVGNDA